MPLASFKLIFLSMLFCHYILSLYYAKNQVKTLITKKETYLPLVILTVLTTLYFVNSMYTYVFVAFIGLHIALSETYSINQFWNLHEIKNPKDIGRLNFLRIIFNILLFIVLLGGDLKIIKIPIDLAFSLMCISFLGMSYFLIKMANKSTINRDFILFETAGLLIAGFTYFKGIALIPQFIVLYHVMTWILFPAISFFKREKLNENIKFFSYNIVISIGFGYLIAQYGIGQFEYWVPASGSLHFLSTFALSRLNPDFISKYFYTNS